MSKDRKNEWEKSYRRGDNFLFYPHEEVIRFVSRFIRKKTGLDDYLDLVKGLNEGGGGRVLDLGCGVGRHVKFCSEMGLDAYGIDLSEAAVTMARKWLTSCGFTDVEARVLQADVRHLPWKDGYRNVSTSTRHSFKN